MISRRLFVIAWKELVQLRRDRLTMAMMAGLPVLQLLLFGYAINTDVRHMPTVIFDQDRSAESRDLVRSMEATGYYDIAGDVRSYDEIGRALRRAKARVALVIPANYGQNVRGGRSTQVQLVVDGSDPQTVASATNTAASLVAARSGELVLSRLSRASGTTMAQPISLEPTVWYNPDLRTATYIVPGLVAVILTFTMIMLTAISVVRERERGTLELLIVSPVNRLELVLGKIFPYIFIGYVQVSLVLAVGHYVFDVPVVGSLQLLYVLIAFFIAANLAIGLFFSTLAKTQQQAMQMSFFFVMPNILLSGFIFPFEGMPKPAQVISQLLPLTHFLRIIRGITLKGADFSDVVGELYWLIAILVVIVTLSSLRFSKKLG